MNVKVTIEDDGTIILEGRGSIIEANGILAQRDVGRERSAGPSDEIIIKGSEAIEPLINGDHATRVHHIWNNAKHAGDIKFER